MLILQTRVCNIAVHYSCPFAVSSTLQQKPFVECNDPLVKHTMAKSKCLSDFLLHWDIATRLCVQGKGTFSCRPRVDRLSKHQHRLVCRQSFPTPGHRIGPADLRRVTLRRQASSACTAVHRLARKASPRPNSKHSVVSFGVSRMLSWI